MRYYNYLGIITFFETVNLTIGGLSPCSAAVFPPNEMRCISQHKTTTTRAGLEKQVKSIARKTGDKIHFIGYTDDFVITGTSQEILLNEENRSSLAFDKKGA